jgi:acyl transferase domain-containing protein
MTHDTPPADAAAYESAIAVVGMACRFAGARTVSEFWKNLRDGVESIVRYTDDELLAAGVPEGLLRHSQYVKAGAPLDEMESFDAAFFGLSPHEAAVMDPQHRHFLEVSWEAFEDAGYDPRRFAGSIGVFAGSGHNAYLPYNLLSRPELLEADGFFLLRHTGNDKDFLTTRVSYVFDLKGPSINVQTACSTSLVAIHMAAQSLLNGECDMVLAGGATIEMPHRQGYTYAEGEILSPDGHCRAFDAASQGTVFGSGAGAVVLKRMTDALRDGDTIHAVLRSSAVNNDGGQKAGYLAPSVDGQAQAVAVAHAIGDVHPETITYIETHGTGTPVGDPIEITALTQAFRQGTDKVGFCRIGSVKTNIGHTDTAAGVASFIKVVESLKHRTLPPSLHYQAPNPACGFEGSPFRVNAKLVPWDAAWPRRAGVHSFGVGGTNAHAIVEEAPVLPPTSPGRAAELLVLSGATPKALDANAQRLAAFLRERPDTSLADAAHTLQEGRQPRRHRRIVVAGSTTEVADLLDGSDPQQVFTAAPADGERNVTFMFAGVGTQYPNMGIGLYKAEAVYRDTIDRCLALLTPMLDYDLRALLYPTPANEATAAAELARTSRTLPAVFITQYAQAQLWISWGISPSAMIGHNLGEYAAAVLSGVFSLEDALRIVVTRGQLVDEVGSGAMLSVPLPADELAPLLPPTVSLAVINGPELSVASGPIAAIEALHKTLEARGVDAVRLHTTMPAHSALLDPILGRFGECLSRVRFSGPKIPFISNLSGTWISPAEATSAEYWVRHLRNTVRFSDGIHTLAADPNRVLLEVGAGRTLTSIVRQHPARSAGQPVLNSMRHPRDEAPDLTFMLGALGRLWAHGVPIKWRALRQGEVRRRIPLPTYAFDRKRHWFAPANMAASPGASALTKRRSDVADWYSQASWERVLPGPAAAQPGRFLVLRDRGGISEALVAGLRAAGHQVVQADAGSTFRRHADGFVLRPDSADDWRALLDALQSDGFVPGAIVHGLALDEVAAPFDVVAAREYSRDGFHSVLALAQALADRDLAPEVTLSVLSTGMLEVAGEPRLEPVKATVLGALRVLPREIPHLRTRVIDVVAPTADWQRIRVVDQLVAELGTAADPQVVAWRGADRWVQGWAPAFLRTASPRTALRRGGAYLITGGLGGLGLALAEHLATTVQARLVLVSRTPLPVRDAWSARATAGLDQGTVRRIESILRMESAGSEVLVATGDVADPERMRVIVAEALSRFGALHGVFHAAGVLHDGIVQLKNDTTAASVLSPKVEGTLSLDAATKELALDFFLLFSSTSAITGLAGQVDYAAANAFLDAYAAARRARDGTPALALGWDAWRDTGMAAALGERASGPDDPVVGRRVRGTADEQLHRTTISTARNWYLREHRLRAGPALIPGTGYLELARASLSARGARQVTLRDVAFLTPCLVSGPEERDLCVRLSGRGHEMRFSICSRVAAGSPDWIEHASGTATGGVGSGAPTDALDVDAIRSRCAVRAQVFSEPHQTTHLDFGPQWDNLRRIDYGAGEALVTLELPARFSDVLQAHPLHPALLDMATGTVQELIPGYDPATDFYVPMSYGTLRAIEPLRASMVSHVRLRAEESLSSDFVTFDVTIADTAGTVLVDITDFVMARVSAAQLGTPPGAATKTVPIDDADDQRSIANTGLLTNLAEGIGTSEGMQVIDAVLAHLTPAHLVVTPRPFSAILREVNASLSEAAAVDGAVPSSTEGTTEFDGPGTATEKLLAELWKKLLGVAHVARTDDFFNLGGHSLTAVKLQRRLRDTMPDRSIAVNDVFKFSTLAALAEHLDAAAGGPAAAPVARIPRRSREAFRLTEPTPHRERSTAS